MSYEIFKTDPTEGGMSLLSRLAKELEDAQANEQRAAEELKEASRRVRELTDRIIPETMEEVGVEKFTATGGLEIKLQEIVTCSLPKERKGPALLWLDEHNHGGLIKRKLEVAFGRDQEEDAAALRSELNQRFPGVREDRKVEPSTLRAFIRQQLEDGVDFPMELFGARRFVRAKVTSAKK